MSAPIGPGDWVECIDTEVPVGGPRPNGYRTGELCVVEEVGEDECGAWLNCVGKVRPRDYGDDEPGWDVIWFRPIYRRDESLIQRLLQPIPAEPDLVSV